MPNRLKSSLAPILKRIGDWATDTSEAWRPVQQDQAYKNRLEKWKQLWFIADVPLFVDDIAVKRLYDALIRPEFEVASRKLSKSKSNTIEDSIEGALSVEAGVAPFLKGTASLKEAGKKGRSSNEGTEYSEEANRSAEFRMEKVVAFYVRNFPKYLFWTSENLSELTDLKGISQEWSKVAERLNEAAPRPLIVLDLRPKSRLIPMAAESTEGKVKLLYKDLIKVLDPDKKVPPYTEAGTGAEGAQEYWKALDAVFDARKAMKVVEDCSTSDGKRLDWIDYRLIAKAEGDLITPLHLHLMPRGEYTTGTFAYQTIRRCFKYGLRIVGTLKQGEDINVLAMYEN